VTGQDGYGTNRLRGYAEEASEWSFGGGDESSPKVMDMIVPEGMKQEDILNYKEHTVALPGISIADFLPSVSKVKVLASGSEDKSVGRKPYKDSHRRTILRCDDW